MDSFSPSYCLTPLRCMVATNSIGREIVLGEVQNVRRVDVSCKVKVKETSVLFTPCQHSVPTISLVPCEPSGTPGILQNVVSSSLVHTKVAYALRKNMRELLSMPLTELPFGFPGRIFQCSMFFGSYDLHCGAMYIDELLFSHLC